MTLQQLKYLIEVADKGSINKAAKSLYISQPSLSNAIRELEEEVNITIFNRTNRGVVLTDEGAEFLAYARKVVEQAKLLERFVEKRPLKQRFGVSTQHYSVAILSFSELIKEYGTESYEFWLRETKVHEIIKDVRDYRSEVGIVYLNKLNERTIKKHLEDNNLEFEELFVAKPMILVSKDNPLANKDEVALEDLIDYPCLSYEQDEYNLFFFSDEILSTILHTKNIKVSERATLVHLISSLNGYSISTGIISNRLKKTGIVSVKLKVDNFVKVGFIINKNRIMSHLGKKYIEILKRNVSSML
ncbi:MAG: LysR family transcriptional regulator [Tissierellia bacterium]|nr:LysR family transcriptional regulator [Tissierellia bacterium]